ncbi:MAG: tryptophan synthase subunit alpha [Betaproteobacteria bacterium]|nr:tryptophan synthase subunit alpha [Betaproteobacteria bacterium]
MSRIASTFARLASQGRKALVPFITAGDPDAATTQELMHTLVAAGADIIELGVPFSDPMADGPTIQRASERALAKGMSLKKVLACVASFRARDQETPVVLMGYANPVEYWGLEEFARSARTAGVDGVLTVDYPPEEAGDYARALTAQEIDPIFLLAPTSTPERVALVAGMARGYVYYVSIKGVTGAGHLDVDAVARRVPEIRAAVGLPVAVGFGVRDAQSAQALASCCDAVIIGSRIIEEIEHSPPEQLHERILALIAPIRAGIDRAGG